MRLPFYYLVSDEAADRLRTLDWDVAHIPVTSDCVHLDGPAAFTACLAQWLEEKNVEH